MSLIRKHYMLLLVAVSCAAIGAAASVIGSAGAATSATGAATHARHGGRRAGLNPQRLLARTVHADLVVSSKGGFVTVTLDRGTVQSVSGQQLTIAEGTKKATYKTVTLTIPAGARVRDNGHKATLASVTAGQRAVVVQAPNRTLVIGRTARGG